MASGVNLVAGRNLEATEVNWFDENAERAWPEIVIVSAAMAESLFPDTPLNDIVGKTVYLNNYEATTIIGIVDRLQASWPGWQYIENASLVPMKRGLTSARYVVRTEPGYRDEIIPQIESMLAESYQGRLIRNSRTMHEIRTDDVEIISMLIA